MSLLYFCINIQYVLPYYTSCILRAERTSGEDNSIFGSLGGSCRVGSEDFMSWKREITLDHIDLFIFPLKMTTIHSWFFSFFPIQDASVCVVVVDNGGQ